MKVGRAKKAVIFSCAVASWGGMAAALQVSSTDATSESGVDSAVASVGPTSPTLSFAPQIDLTQISRKAPVGGGSLPLKVTGEKANADSIAQSALKAYGVVQSEALAGSHMAAGNRVLPTDEQVSKAASGAIEIPIVDLRGLVSNPYVVVPQIELPGIALAHGPALEIAPVSSPRASSEIASAASVRVPPELLLHNVMRSGSGGSFEIASRDAHQNSVQMADYLLTSTAEHATASPLAQAVVLADQSGQVFVITDPAVPLDNLQPTALIAATTSARVQAWQSLFHSALDSAPADPRGKTTTLDRPAVLMTTLGEAAAKSAVHASLISSLMPDFSGRISPPAAAAKSVAQNLIATLTDEPDSPLFYGVEAMGPSVGSLAPAPNQLADNQAPAPQQIMQDAQPSLALAALFPSTIATEGQAVFQSVDWFIQMSNEAGSDGAADMPADSTEAQSGGAIASSAMAGSGAADSAPRPALVDGQTFSGDVDSGDGQAAVYSSPVTGYLPPQRVAVSVPVLFVQYASPSHRWKSPSLAAAWNGSIQQPTASSMALGFATPLIARPNQSVASPGLSLPVGVIGYKVVDLNPGGLVTSSQSDVVLGTESAGYIQEGTSFAHAAFWSSTNSSYSDLNPSSSYSDSRVTGFNGSQLVGSATINQIDHAIVWVYSASQGKFVATDLNPSAFSSSYALASNGTRQVGYGYTNAQYGSHALMWNSSATSYYDLNPAGFSSSEALGAYGNFEVGDGQFTNSAGSQLHALLWTGTSTAATDLQPTDLSVLDSRAVSIVGTSAGGYGTDAATRYSHALLWPTLSAANAVDLNPAGYIDSQVTAVDGTVEVGFGRLATDLNTEHALLWLGSSTSYTDLNQYLPSGYTSAEAEGIDATGDVVGWALNTATGNYHAVEWVIQLPEPSALATLTIVAAGLGGRRRRKRRSLEAENA